MENQITTIPLISQELFDETLLENEEIFELSPDEALQETIDQFTKQQQQVQPNDGNNSTTTTKFLDHLCLLHPHSSQGKQERMIRQQFVQWCNDLDTCIHTDGTVIVNDTTIPLMVQALQGIQEKCSHKNNNNNKSSFLFLFQQQQSMYTLMSLLGVVTAAVVVDGENDNETTTAITQGREIILKETMKTLTMLLWNIPSLRDTFVAWERWMELFKRYATSVTTTTTTTTNHIPLVVELLRLAHVACLNCESNKVNWMKTCRRKAGGIELLLECVQVNNHNVVVDVDSTMTNITQMKIQACKLIIVLCRFDDFRDSSSPSTTIPSGQSPSLSGAGLPTVSSAHDNVLELSRTGAVPVLIKLLKQNTSTMSTDNNNDCVSSCSTSSCADQELCSFNLQALRVLAIQDDIIQSMVALGLLQLVQECLCTSLQQVEEQQQQQQQEEGTIATTTHDAEENDDNDNEKKNATTTTSSSSSSSSSSSLVSIVAATLGLMRNLSGNDDIKTTLCIGSSTTTITSSSSSSSSTTKASLPQILKAMKLYSHHTLIQQHGCGTLAAMALRRPTNVVHILQQNGHVSILNAMKGHPTNVSIQRQGSLAIRNIVSRPLPTNATISDDSTALEAKDIVLEAGAEPVLKDIASLHQGSVDEAYAALRDLGIQGVKLLKVGSDGRLQNRSSSYNVAGVVGGEGSTTTTTKRVSNFRPVFETSRELDD